MYSPCLVLACFCFMLRSFTTECTSFYINYTNCSTFFFNFVITLQRFLWGLNPNTWKECWTWHCFYLFSGIIYKGSIWAHEEKFCKCIFKNDSCLCPVDSHRKSAWSFAFLNILRCIKKKELWVTDFRNN